MATTTTTTVTTIMPSGETVRLPVTREQSRLYRSFFVNVNGDDCGCGCGPDCSVYRPPFTPEERLRAHARARQAIKPTV